jgi:hypothetical protein
MDRIFQALARPAHPAAVSVVAAILALSTLIADRAEILQPNAGITPVKAIAAARKANVAGPVLNAYNFGGYLIFAGIPPYIDGRADLYGDAFLKEMMEATSGTSAERLANLLQKRHIGWTLLSANTAAAELLDHLPGWRRLYADEVAVVHVRVPTGTRRP